MPSGHAADLKLGSQSVRKPGGRGRAVVRYPWPRSRTQRSRRSRASTTSIRRCNGGTPTTARRRESGTTWRAIMANLTGRVHRVSGV